MRHLWVLAVVAACASAGSVPTQRGPTYVVRPYYVNFVPFGAGQFQNDESGKGTALAIGEGATVATSVGIWLYLAQRYGVESNEVPVGDVARVHALQLTEIGTGIAALALYGTGVVDSLYHYRARVRLVPLVAPGGGISIMWWR